MNLSDNGPNDFITPDDLEKRLEVLVDPYLGVPYTNHLEDYRYWGNDNPHNVYKNHYRYLRWRELNQQFDNRPAAEFFLMCTQQAHRERLDGEPSDDTLKPPQDNPMHPEDEADEHDFPPHAHRVMATNKLDNFGDRLMIYPEATRDKLIQDIVDTENEILKDEPALLNSGFSSSVNPSKSSISSITEQVKDNYMLGVLEDLEKELEEGEEPTFLEFSHRLTQISSQIDSDETHSNGYGKEMGLSENDSRENKYSGPFDTSIQIDPLAKWIEKKSNSVDDETMKQDKYYHSLDHGFYDMAPDNMRFNHPNDPNERKLERVEDGEPLFDETLKKENPLSSRIPFDSPDQLNYYNDWILYIKNSQQHEHGEKASIKTCSLPEPSANLSSAEIDMVHQRLQAYLDYVSEKKIMSHYLKSHTQLEQVLKQISSNGESQSSADGSNSHVKDQIALISEFNQFTLNLEEPLLMSSESLEEVTKSRLQREDKEILEKKGNNLSQDLILQPKSDDEEELAPESENQTKSVTKLELTEEDFLDPSRIDDDQYFQAALALERKILSEPVEEVISDEEPIDEFQQQQPIPGHIEFVLDRSPIELLKELQSRPTADELRQRYENKLIERMNHEKRLKQLQLYQISIKPLLDSIMLDLSQSNAGESNQSLIDRSKNCNEKGNVLQSLPLHLTADSNYLLSQINEKILPTSVFYFSGNQNKILGVEDNNELESLDPNSWWKFLENEFSIPNQSELDQKSCKSSFFSSKSNDIDGSDNLEKFPGEYRNINNEGLEFRSNSQDHEFNKSFPSASENDFKQCSQLQVPKFNTTDGNTGDFKNRSFEFLKRPIEASTQIKLLRLEKELSQVKRNPDHEHKTLCFPGSSDGDVEDDWFERTKYIGYHEKLERDYHLLILQSYEDGLHNSSCSDSSFSLPKTMPHHSFDTEPTKKNAFDSYLSNQLFSPPMTSLENVNGFTSSLEIENEAASRLKNTRRELISSIQTATVDDLTTIDAHFLTKFSTLDAWYNRDLLYKEAKIIATDTEFNTFIRPTAIRSKTPAMTRRWYRRFTMPVIKFIRRRKKRWWLPLKRNLYLRPRRFLQSFFIHPLQIRHDIDRWMNWDFNYPRRHFIEVSPIQQHGYYRYYLRHLRKIHEIPMDPTPSYQFGTSNKISNPLKGRGAVKNPLMYGLEQRWNRKKVTYRLWLENQVQSGQAWKLFAFWATVSIVGYHAFRYIDKKKTIPHEWADAWGQTVAQRYIQGQYVPTYKPSQFISGWMLAYMPFRRTGPDAIQIAPGDPGSNEPQDPIY